MFRFVVHGLLILLVLAAMPACQAQSSKAAQMGDEPGRQLATERVSAETFNERLSSLEHPQLLDVRTANEYAQGILEGAINIDVLKGGFVDQANRALDNTQTVFVYCRSGNRSQKAMAQLHEAGFAHVVELSTGFRGWVAAGMTTVMPGNDAQH